MSANSKIEWTDASWNPVTGCTEVSPGCDRCYAKTFAERFRGKPDHYFENGFDVQLRPNKLRLPFTWRKPKKVFVNSMSDLFHVKVPDKYIAQVFAVMAATPQHTYQILTKRHGRMRSLLRSERFVDEVGFAWHEMGGQEKALAWSTLPLPNVWLGVSVEDQKRADLRIPALLDTPAAVHWLSCEPLLGPVDPWLATTPWDKNKIGWIVAGGESGVGARPLDLDWVRALREHCVEVGVPFLFKQVGGHTSKTGGRDLDGRTWDEYPALTASGAP